ncbi:hypothetical protein MN116_007392 [Schistosoma mekongi]|uniref:ferroxidase n=1 Tax=Schistosoma mekongi TaxID=38744 RepID=A0AAE2D4G8_SCHME|nr:hypothetical protein MN116_007392 [Schistosoma mekongi]
MTSESFRVKRLTNCASNLHEIIQRNNDPTLCDFIRSEYLHEQEDAIKQFADYVTQTIRVRNGLGGYLFDKMTLN